MVSLYCSDVITLILLHLLLHRIQTQRTMAIALLPIINRFINPNSMQPRMKDDRPLNRGNASNAF